MQFTLLPRKYGADDISYPITGHPKVGTMGVLMGLPWSQEWKLRLGQQYRIPFIKSALPIAATEFTIC